MNKEFDFSEFFDKSIVADCLINLEEPAAVEIKAHKLILANSSNFFFNMFTGQMDEELTGTVNLKYNPGNLLPAAIKWMYNGKIFYEDYDIESLLKLYAVSAFYTIENLQNELKKVISAKIPQTEMLKYCDYCYKQNLNETLNYLAVLIGEKLEKYEDISKMSDILDVRVYALALKNSNLSTRKKLENIEQFIGDYEMIKQDIDDLKQAIHTSNDKEQTNKIIEEFPNFLCLIEK